MRAQITTQMKREGRIDYIDFSQSVVYNAQQRKVMSTMKLDKKQVRLYELGLPYVLNEYGHWYQKYVEYHGRKPIEFWYMCLSPSFLLAEGVDFDDDLLQ